MASKRKWDEFDDSDDEEPAFGRQILPVANLPEDFDDTPCDGMQYLFTVRYGVSSSSPSSLITPLHRRDARYLPHVTRAPNPYEIDTPQPAQEDVHEIPNHITLPSEEWRTVFENRFKNFRKVSQTILAGIPIDAYDLHRISANPLFMYNLHLKAKADDLCPTKKRGIYGGPISRESQKRIGTLPRNQNKAN